LSVLPYAHTACVESLLTSVRDDCQTGFAVSPCQAIPKVGEASPTVLAPIHLLCVGCVDSVGQEGIEGQGLYPFQSTILAIYGQPIS